MRTTASRGNATEAAVLRALADRDILVLIPFGEGHPYDLLVDLQSEGWVRVQCKTARVYKGCVVFNSRSTDHGSGAGTYLGLADVFGVSCPETGSVYLVPVNEVPTSVVYLRLEPTRNNQRSGVRLASDYEIDQLSEHELRERLAESREHQRPALELVAPLSAE